MSVSDTPRLQCPKCPRTFPTDSQLRHHMKGHGSDTPFLCDTCGFTTRHFGSMNVHRKLHDGKNRSLLGIPLHFTYRYFAAFYTKILCMTLKFISWNLIAAYSMLPNFYLLFKNSNYRKPNVIMYMAWMFIQSNQKKSFRRPPQHAHGNSSRI